MSHIWTHPRLYGIKLGGNLNAGISFSALDGVPAGLSFKDFDCCSDTLHGVTQCSRRIARFGTVASRRHFQALMRFKALFSSLRLHVASH